MRVLNGYAGLGGNRKLWTQDHEITAVELDPAILKVYKSLYANDTAICADVMQYLLNHYQEFDAAWFSPPCQSNSAMMKFTRHKKRWYPDLSIYQLIIFLTHFFKGKWVVENVNPYYDPLIKPTKIIGRHLFWSNFEIEDFLEEKNFEGFIKKGTVKDSEDLKKWLGIEYSGNLYYKGNHDPNQVLRNCVHPKTGLHVFNCMLKSLTTL